MARPGLRALEIGSYAGGSAIALAKAGATVTCVDPWEPAYLNGLRGTQYSLTDMRTALERGDAFRLFLHNVKAAGVADRIRYHKGFSSKVLPTLQEVYDLIYVDGDHRYAQVQRDLELCMRLLSADGVLCGDDLELQFDHVDQAACRRDADQDFVRDPRTRTPFHPGVTLAVWEFFGGRVSVRNGFWAMQRYGDGWRQLDTLKP